MSALSPTPAQPPPDLPGVTTHYTYDDYREATLAVQRRDQRLARETPLGATPADQTGQRPRRRDHLLRLSFGVLFPVFFLIFGVFRARLPGFLAARPDEYYLLRLVVPIALYFLTTGAIMRLAARAQNGGAGLPRSPAERRAGAVALTAYVLLAAAVCVVGIAGPAPVSRELLLHDLALLVLPWVIVFLLLYLQHVEPMRRAGGLLRWQWDANPGLHVEKTITVDDVAFHLSDRDARYKLRWDGLTAIEETDNLFTLISGRVFYMLPKRVLTPDQIAFVRHLSDPSSNKPTGGFPVLPPKSS